MFSLSSLVVAAAAVASVFAFPTNVTEGEGFGLLARAGTPSATGTNNGFYYSWWTDGAAQATYTNGGGGQYSLNWSNNNGNLVGGKGWNPGSSSRTIHYTGTYTPNGNSYLSVYGWTRSPLIEYYVVESYGSTTLPPLPQRRDLCLATEHHTTSSRPPGPTNPLSMVPRPSSSSGPVRNPKRAPGGAISGTVTTSCHFNAWSALGMKLGTAHNYQIVATEGYKSAGSSTITVS